MHLSVIIPASNGEQCIGKTLPVIHAYLRQAYPAEIVVADDGPHRSSGETGGAARALRHRCRSRGAAGVTC
jgi:hypothetical protein